MAHLGPIHSGAGRSTAGCGAAAGQQALRLHPAQGLEPSDGTITSSPEGSDDWNQRKQPEGLHFAGKSASISSIVLTKLLVDLLGSF